MNLFDKSKLPFDLPVEKEGYSMELLDEQRGIFRIKIPDGDLFFAPNFFDEKVSDRAIDFFLENENGIDFHQINWREYEKEKLEEIKWCNIKWHHDKIKMFGKEVFLPRFSAWYGEDDAPYTYSGLKLLPNLWNNNKGLQFIRSKIEEVAGVQFNSVLLNWYRDGSDYISWHTDAEKELGENPVIGSVNFGATRLFSLRRNDNHKEIITIPLSHGTLLIMGGATQHQWQHAVKKEKKIKKLRINLTFRTIYTSGVRG